MVRIFFFYFFFIETTSHTIMTCSSSCSCVIIYRYKFRFLNIVIELYNKFLRRKSINDYHGIFDGELSISHEYLNLLSSVGAA